MFGKDIVKYDAGGVAHQPKASQSPSIVRRFADMLSFGHATGLVREAEHTLGVDYVAAGFETIGKAGVGVVTGAGMGMLESHGMADVDGVPIDGAAMGLSALVGVGSPNSSMGETARNAVTAFSALFSNRMTRKWQGAAPKSAGVHGDMGAEDPIIAAARDL
jgi:hypothetical protein